MSLPQKMDVLKIKLCKSVERLQLPLCEFMQGPEVQQMNPATRKDPKTHLRCTLTAAVTGECLGEFYVPKNRPWLDAVPYGQICHLWQLSHFNLMQGTDLIFPCPRLSKLVPGDVDATELQLVRRRDTPPLHVKMVVGKPCPHTYNYQPPAGTSPLYEFCELQTLLLTDSDERLLRDLDFRIPEGPVAKKLLERFYEMIRINKKVGKRKLGEFRKDSRASCYIIHVLVSPDLKGLCLRAKMVYETPYLVVPVVEGPGAAPWDKRSYAAVCQAIETAGV